MSSQNIQNTQPSDPSLIIPDDFADRLASKIVAINDKEQNETQASAKVAMLIYRNLSKPAMIHYFIPTMEKLLESDEGSRYAATSWISLIINDDEYPEYTAFHQNLLSFVVEQYCSNSHTLPQVETKNKKFSSYAHMLGTLFIKMVQVHSDYYSVVVEIYTRLIKLEVNIGKYLEEQKNEEKPVELKIQKKTSQNAPDVTKKLYDDVIDYISHRGQYKSESLNQKNPNEFINALAERMRNTRRYTIQDIMNRHALERKKQQEKDLQEKAASPEELIMAINPFKQGLKLYWIEKMYNFKYLGVEKVRITLQIVSALLGLGSIVLGYLEVSPLGLIESVFIAVAMFGFSKVGCSKSVFTNYYPNDVSSSLEQAVGSFTPVMRKMSKIQMQAFLIKQIKDPENDQLAQLIPEFIKYIYAIMPDRNKVMIQPDELTDILGALEMTFAKANK